MLENEKHWTDAWLKFSPCRGGLADAKKCATIEEFWKTGHPGHKAWMLVFGLPESRDFVGDAYVLAAESALSLLGFTLKNNNRLCSLAAKLKDNPWVISEIAAELPNEICCKPRQETINTGVSTSDSISTLSITYSSGSFSSSAPSYRASNRTLELKPLPQVSVLSGGIIIDIRYEIYFHLGTLINASYPNPPFSDELCGRS